MRTLLGATDCLPLPQYCPHRRTASSRSNRALQALLDPPLRQADFCRRSFSGHRELTLINHVPPVQTKQQEASAYATVVAPNRD